MSEMETFGSWVRQRRRELNLTQADLARQVGCATITIRKIEQDERRPSPQMADLLAQQLAIAEGNLEAFMRLARGQYVPTPKQPQAAALPAFLDPSAEPNTAEISRFVGRDEPLAQLESWLQAALAGQGRLAFISGEAGRGKTSLLAEFTRRALNKHEKLVAASGICNAFSGSGDPYLPFRDILSMLSGDVEARWLAGTIGREQASRLWSLAPFTFRTLLSDGQGLVDVLLPAASLFKAIATHPNSSTGLVEQMRQASQQLTARQQELEQRQLFEQLYQVLYAMAARLPLLLLLDDLQWADGATVNMLFHLGRRLPGSRILIVGAYRPSEVALGRLDAEGSDGQAHPLQPVIHELTRHYGEIEIDLSRFESAGDQAFVDALLDSEPHRLDQEFRQALFWRTKGHPLFTIELLRALQEQGDLVRDATGYWVASDRLSWEALPARVEAVIAQRIGRLDETLRQILTVASVEGELFTAQVVAQVLQMPERKLLGHLSRELSQRHRLVREQQETEVGDQYLTHYQFRHALFQQYLYNSLSPGERRLYHRDVAQVLEQLYQDEPAAMVVPLANHFRQAGQRQKAIAYTRQAADRAEAMYAFSEAIQHLTSALAQIRPGEQPETRLVLLERLADLHMAHGEHPLSIPIYQEVLGLLHSQSGTEPMSLVRLHRKIGAATVNMTWFADRQQYGDTGREHLELGWQLAQSQPPHVETVRLLVTRANAARRPHLPDWQATEHFARAAVEMAETVDSPVDLSAALNVLGEVYGAAGLFRERVQIARQRLALSASPDFSHPQERASILMQTGRALVQVGEYHQALPFLRDAEALARQIQALDVLLMALRYQATCHFWLDHWDEVMAIDQQWRALEQRFPNFAERAGPTCYLIALIATVRALQGDTAQCQSMRQESVAVMIANDGPQEGWGRDNLY